jgi:hypothetical protein
MTDPVRGTLQITSASMADPDASSQNYSLHGVVSADGLAPTPIEHSGMARTSKWPQPGETLPVTVDRADPTRIRIEWEEVQTGAEQGLQQAQALAAALGGAGRGAVPGATVVASEPVVIDARNVAGLREDILGTLRQHGIKVPDSATVAAAGGAGGADSAERLRKLDALRDQGLITPEEHDAQRRRIIDAL